MSDSPDEEPVTEVFYDAARAASEANRDLTRLGHLLVQLDLGKMKPADLAASGGVHVRFRKADAAIKELTEEFETLRARLEADGLINPEEPDDDDL